MDDALAEVVERLKQISGPDGLALVPTPRLKTQATTAEKLRREREGLSQIHDLGGARIVLSGGRTDQDRVRDLIVADFDQTKEPIDRRAEPSYGYRAVHVVVRCQNRWIEVQIRTKLQHMWAEVIERLADVWGRQIRYGEPPDEPDAPFGTLTREDFVEQWKVLMSDAIDESETLSQSVEALDSRMTEAAAESDDETIPAHELQEFAKLKTLMSDHHATMEARLESVRQVVIGLKGAGP